MISRLIWLLLGIVFGFVTVFWGRSVWLAYDSRNWPTIRGVVIAFYETPEYKYSVAGQSYTNSNASCNELFNSLVSIRNSSKYAEKYPLDATVTVRYCPSEPALAVLETTFDRSGILLVISLFLMTSLCVVGFVFGWQFRAGLRTRH